MPTFLRCLMLPFTQVKKSLKDAKEGLHHLIRLAGIKEEVLVTLQGAPVFLI